MQPTIDRPLIRVAKAELNELMAALEVTFVSLSECLISPGWQLVLRGPQTSCIHYNLSGTGRLRVEGHGCVELRPHTLVIVPANSTFSFEVPRDEDPHGQLLVKIADRRFSRPATYGDILPETASPIST